MGIIISQYKDPYKPTSIMESNKGYFRSSNESDTVLGLVILHAVDGSDMLLTITSWGW